MLGEHPHILYLDEDLSPLSQPQLSVTLLRDLRVHDGPGLGRQFDFHEWPGGIDVFNRRRELGWLGWMMLDFQEMGAGIGHGSGGIRQIHQRQLQTKRPKMQRAVLHASMKDVDMPEEVIDEWRCRVLVDLVRLADLLDLAFPHDDDAIG